jgi:hypothetical protein
MPQIILVMIVAAESAFDADTLAIAARPGALHKTLLHLPREQKVNQIEIELDAMDTAGSHKVGPSLGFQVTIRETIKIKS